jgi:hypothetical protein
MNELREKILKQGKVSKASATISQKMYENFTMSPLEIRNQDIVEIGIDDLITLFSTELEKEIIKELKWAKDASVWNIEARIDYLKGERI